MALVLLLELGCLLGAENRATEAEYLVFDPASFGFSTHCISTPLCERTPSAALRPYLPFAEVKQPDRIPQLHNRVETASVHEVRSQSAIFVENI